MVGFGHASGEALAKAPASGEDRFRLARAQAVVAGRLGHDEALERAVALGTGHPGLELNLGTALARSGDCDRALTILDELIANHPDRYQAHYWRWHCLTELGRPAEAAAALDAYQSAR